MIERKYSVSEIKEIRRLVDDIDRWDQYDDEGCGVTTPMNPDDREAQVITYMSAGTTVEELAAELNAIHKSKGF